MTATKAISISVGVSILIGAAILLTVLPEFAGKGRYDKSAFWFPYAFLTLHLLDSYALLLPLMLGQFPAYGWFYGWSWSKHQENRATIWLLSTHLVLGISSSVLYRIDNLVSRGVSPF